MHHRHQYGHEGGHRRGRLFGRPFPNRHELLDRLTAYQRDLEQELADVADVIKHLRGNDAPPQEPAQG